MSKDYALAGIANDEPTNDKTEYNNLVKMTARALEETKRLEISRIIQTIKDSNLASAELLKDKEVINAIKFIRDLNPDEFSADLDVIKFIRHPVLSVDELLEILNIKQLGKEATFASNIISSEQEKQLLEIIKLQLIIFQLNNEFLTPDHISAIGKEIEAGKINVNFISEQGSFLHFIASLSNKFNAEKIIDLLLQHGAMVNREDKEGNTPLDIAKQEIRKYLSFIPLIKNELKANASKCKEHITRLIADLKDLGGLSDLDHMELKNYTNYQEAFNKSLVLLETIEANIKAIELPEGTKDREIIINLRKETKVYTQHIEYMLNECSKANLEYLELLKQRTTKTADETEIAQVSDRIRLAQIVANDWLGVGIDVTANIRRATRIVEALETRLEQEKQQEIATLELVDILQNYSTQAEAVEKLSEAIKRGANLNQVDQDGNTPLHLAACIQDQKLAAQAVKILLKNGAKFNVSNNYNETPLDIAKARDNKKCMRIFSTLKLIDNLKRKLPSLDVLSEDISYNADVNQIDQDGNTPLHLAACIENEKLAAQVAEILLAKGAKFNVSNNDSKTPLDIAKVRDNKKCIRIFSTLKLIDNLRGENPSIDTLSEAINDKANLNQVDQDGNTPLHLVAYIQDQTLAVQAAKILLANGAKVNTRNKDGKTALELARESDNAAVITILEEARQTLTKQVRQIASKVYVFALQVIITAASTALSYVPGLRKSESPASPLITPTIHIEPLTTSFDATAISPAEEASEGSSISPTNIETKKKQGYGHTRALLEIRTPQQPILPRSLSTQTLSELSDQERHTTMRRCRSTQALLGNRDQSAKTPTISVQ